MVRPGGARQNFAIGDLSKGATYEIPGANHHLEKRKQRNKGLSIVFDPAAHKEFVTGFRKRKMQRRKVALKDQDEKARKIRIEERKKHREDRKKALQNRMVGGSKEGGDGGGAGGGSDEEDGEGDEEAEEVDVQTYKSGGQTTYVQVEAIKTGSDIEDDGGSGGEEEEEGGTGGGAAAKAVLAGKPKVRELKGKKLTEALKRSIKPKKGFKKPNKKKKVAKRKGHK